MSTFNMKNYLYKNKPLPTLIPLSSKCRTCLETTWGDGLCRCERERKMTFLNKVKDYYPIYLTKHENKWNRRLHMLGQSLTILTILCLLDLTFTSSRWYALLLPLTWFITYLFAWSGHFFIEKNRPETFSVNPLITKICDWKMYIDIIRGKIRF